MMIDEIIAVHRDELDELWLLSGRCWLHVGPELPEKFEALGRWVPERSMMSEDVPQGIARSAIRHAAAAADFKEHLTSGGRTAVDAVAFWQKARALISARAELQMMGAELEPMDMAAARRRFSASLRPDESLDIQAATLALRGRLAMELVNTMIMELGPGELSADVWVQISAHEQRQVAGVMLCGLLEHLWVAGSARDKSCEEAVAQACYEHAHPGGCWEALSWWSRHHMIESLQEEIPHVCLDEPEPTRDHDPWDDP